MNSSKRGAVYGFKLQSLDLVRRTCFPYPLTVSVSIQAYSIINLVLCSQLIDTKSTDRKLTLLHYIANVVKEKYQQVALFYNELHYVEKAAAGTICRKQNEIHLMRHLI